MKREEALSLVGKRVQAWTAANGVYVGTLTHVLVVPGKPWRALVLIDGVLEPAQHYERGCACRRGFRAGETIQVGGNSVSLSEETGTDYLSALKRCLAAAQKALAERPDDRFAWLRRAVAGVLPIAIAAEEIRMVTGDWQLRQLAARPDLQSMRRREADAAFAAYDFGPQATVEEADSWTWTSPGKEISRKVYLRFDDAPEEHPTEAASFTVCFADEQSWQVVDAGALLLRNGALLGHMPRPADDHAEDEANPDSERPAERMTG